MSKLEDKSVVESEVKRGDRHQVYLICALLILVTTAVYWQVVNFQFVNFDDNVCVQNNPIVLAGPSPAAVQYAFTTPFQANWIPLVWVSYMVDHDLGEYILDSNSAGIYHLTNVLLHLANVLLLFLVLSRLTGSRWRSAFVAALFAIHPLHVESVAWVTERKDVLSTLFWMLTMLAYLRYVERPDTRRYGLVVLVFALGLMSKSMLVTLPLMLLLLDYWPLGRMSSAGGFSWAGAWKMISEKMSLWVLAALGCGITLWAQGHGGAVANLGSYPFGVRAANALVAYMAYIVKMFWPSGLVFLYPHPGSSLPVWQVIGSAVLLIGLTVLAVSAGRKRGYIAVGWLWYVITLVPVIGLVQVGKQAMADRYTYIPFIGIFIIIAWGVPDLLARAMKSARPRAALLAVLSVAVIAALMPLTYKQVGYWRDSVSLCTHAISVNFANPLAHLNLGSALQDQGDLNAAINQYRMALKLQPDYVDAHFDLGTALAKQGKTDEAIKHFNEALRIFPPNSMAHDALGVIMAQGGKLDDAIYHFRQALKYNSQDRDAQSNLDNALNLKAQGQ